MNWCFKTNWCFQTNCATQGEMADSIGWLLGTNPPAPPPTPQHRFPMLLNISNARSSPFGTRRLTLLKLKINVTYITSCCKSRWDGIAQIGVTRSVDHSPALESWSNTKAGRNGYIVWREARLKQRRSQLLYEP